MDFSQPVEISFVALSVGVIFLIIAVGIGLVYRAKKKMTKIEDN